MDSTLIAEEVKLDKSIFVSDFKMASYRKIEDKIVMEKLAVITFDDVVNEMAFRRYLKKNWGSLTFGLKRSTILFMAGIHGKESGVLGEVEDIQTLKNQVRIIDYLSILF